MYMLVKKYHNSKIGGNDNYSMIQEHVLMLQAEPPFCMGILYNTKDTLKKCSNYVNKKYNLNRMYIFNIHWLNIIR